jgi:DNA (cytosine-5)-methyltransferase 1
MQSYLIKNLTSNRQIPRLWLEGKVPANAGFLPRTRYNVLIECDGEGLDKVVKLKLAAEGTRVVTGATKNSKEVPIIDLNSREVLGMFEGMEQVRVIVSEGEITISPLATQTRIKERLDRIKDKVKNREPIAVGSLSHGGGVLSLAVHDGLQESGLGAELAFANDIREDLLLHEQEKNPSWNANTKLIAAPMQEFAFDQKGLKALPQCDLLEAGIPCNGASLSGRAKGGLDCAEAHADVGHLLVAFLCVVAAANPAVVVLENVPPYQNTASMWILRHQLRDLGYDVHETVLEGQDWNVLEHRKRLCMVAVTVGMEFSMSDIYKPEPMVRTLGEVLQDVPVDDPSWSSMQYLKDKEVRDKEAGKGFAMQIVGPASTKVGTIGKSYQKNRSTEPKVAHPSDPSLLRLLSPVEHCGVKGIRPKLIEGLCSTTAHELLGQSIVPAPFVQVGKAIGETIWAFASVRRIVRNEEVPVQKTMYSPVHTVKAAAKQPEPQDTQLSLI